MRCTAFKVMAKSSRIALTGLLHRPEWHEILAVTCLCHSQSKQAFSIGNLSTILFLANLLQASSCMLHDGGDRIAAAISLYGSTLVVTFTEVTDYKMTWLCVVPWAPM